MFHLFKTIFHLSSRNIPSNSSRFFTKLDLFKSSNFLSSSSLSLIRGPRISTLLTGSSCGCFLTGDDSESVFDRGRPLSPPPDRSKYKEELSVERFILRKVGNRTFKTNLNYLKTEENPTTRESLVKKSKAESF